jgi:hypothetical protein
MSRNKRDRKSQQQSVSTYRTDKPLQRPDFRPKFWPGALGHFIAELTQRASTLAICATFLASGGWIIYLGGLWAAFIVFFSTLWALWDIQRGRRY